MLGVNATTIYKLWKKGYLDYWKINGTMKTNITAIDGFLQNYKNIDLGQTK